MKSVFIHGLGQTPSSWDGVKAYIDNRDEVLCPDIMGLFEGQNCRYETLYTAFEGHCQEVGEPLRLCGLSLGGVLALDYASRHPQNVASLVLIGTQFAMPKGLLRFQNVMFRLMPKSAFKGSGLNKNQMIELCRTMMSLNFENELEKISCPSLVVCGEKDKANIKAAEELSVRLPDARLEIIPNAAHELNTQAPQKLAEIINKFYNEI